ncbi:hypothetical protein BC628DRAFT_1337644 [Trametes gibbosa]|nr:hypothetical protein BC628DRAFT_1337644 [Trametes gibbosa]
MGKLNIAHHKSYHPYRRDNIERVRRDEEAAREAEAVAEGRMMLAVGISRCRGDSEARIDLLRARAGLTGSKKQSKRREEEQREEAMLAGSSETVVAAATAVSTLTSSSGHINLFEDLERSLIPVQGRSTKRPPPVEDEKGVALAPSEKDLKPWYVDASRDPSSRPNTGRAKPWETEEDRLRRELQRKSAHDPLTAINTQLASRSGPHPSSSAQRPRARALPPRSDAEAPPEISARLTRESAERERARALIARRKREMAGSETPSTVHGARGGGGGYGDVFNRREVEEVRRERQMGWDRERERDRDGGRRYGGRW